MRRNRHGKLFAAFADECLLLRFAFLHLAADELPQKSTRLMRRTLADHKPVAVPDKSCNHLYHSFPLSVPAFAAGSRLFLFL